MRNGVDTHRVNVTLRPHETLALRLLAGDHGLTEPEILRIGLRLLWRLHRLGKFKAAPRLAWRQNPNSSKRRRRQ